MMDAAFRSWRRCNTRTGAASSWPSHRCRAVRRRPMKAASCSAAAAWPVARCHCPIRCRSELAAGASLENALRLRDAVALRKVHADVAQHLDDLGVLGELSDGLLAGEVTDLVDRAHHLAIDRVVQDLAHEAAVDLQVIHREVLQVTERGQAGTEVVERKLAAQLLERLDEAIG